MGWIKVGIYSALPYIAGFFGILFAGWWSDFMLRRRLSLNIARKLPVIVGLVMASTIVAANYVHSDAAVVRLSWIFMIGDIEPLKDIQMPTRNRAMGGEGAPGG